METKPEELRELEELRIKYVSNNKDKKEALLIENIMQEYEKNLKNKILVGVLNKATQISYTTIRNRQRQKSETTIWTEAYCYYAKKILNKTDIEISNFLGYKTTCFAKNSFDSYVEKLNKKSEYIIADEKIRFALFIKGLILEERETFILENIIIENLNKELGVTFGEAIDNNERQKPKYVRYRQAYCYYIYYYMNIETNLISKRIKMKDRSSVTCSKAVWEKAITDKYNYGSKYKEIDKRIVSKIKKEKQLRRKNK